MARTRRAVLAAATTSLVFTAGCLGGDGDGDSTDTDTETDNSDTTTDGGEMTTTAGEGTTTTEGGMSGATVMVSDHPELGEILVDGEGMTLYMFDNDTNGSKESTCSGGCLDAWPPLTVEGDVTGDEGVSAALSTFDRGGGTLQVAAAGWPLYYFASDQAAGDANGQGVNDVWWVLRPDGTPVKGDEMMTETESGGSGGTPTERDY
ncbi:COG4315 family predicted lipoprotein [Haloarchaeobius sp. DFWS5]|uniref:COG4315 family predicted lipoprotein n=1 Tax=Haloarchaeobius sp. DFWS5 TaxID=3446114 RepID=UPI003EB74864